MATLRYHFRPSKVRGSSGGKLFIRVIHSRQVKDIPTDYSLQTEEWDRLTRRIVYHGYDYSRNVYLSKIEERMKHDLANLKSIEKTLKSQGNYTSQDLANRFKSAFTDNGSLAAYCEKVSTKLIDSGQTRTARAYCSAVRSLKRFLGNKELQLTDIDSGLMRKYESYLGGRGLGKNTISFYMRNLRALYYRAIEDKLIQAKPDNPFANVYTGVHLSKKRALELKDIRALRELAQQISGLKDKEKEIRRRNTWGGLYDSLLYFNFCLEARGMSWVDMVFLKKNDIREGTFIYRRKKTDQELEIIVTPTMSKILSHFAGRTEGSPYVFPVIHPSKGSERQQYESGLRIQNERLALVAKMAGLEKKVTTHVSRHSWATIAKREKIDISLISELLGHNNIKTTYRYLACFDQSEMVKATEQVANALQAAS